MSMNNINVSIIKDVTKNGAPITSECSITQLIEGIKTGGKVLSTIQKVRQIDRDKAKEEYTNIKLTLPAFSFSRFKNSSCINDNFLSAIAFPFDADHLTESQIIQAIVKLKNDPHVFLCFISPGGNGLKFFVLIEEIDNPDEYKSKYEQMRKYYEKLIGYKLDKIDDVRRLTFVSYDPECYYNPNATPYTNFPEPVIHEQNYYEFKDNSADIENIKCEDVISKFRW